ncbi:hypothetical protein [Nonomuraea dietziae]|uniref:hypothetical protein n=1 Tax=Nonomuraea dietziae TaxID=65515 RepID=UPI0031DD32A0
MATRRSTTAPPGILALPRGPATTVKYAWGLDGRQDGVEEASFGRRRQAAHRPGRQDLAADQGRRG